MKRAILFSIVSFFSFQLSLGQGSRISVSDFISQYRQLALEEMALHRIPASIKLAQAILESGSGNSQLAVNANNFFGIKCNGWTGRTYHKDDDKPNECFRAYNSAEESFRDHSQFLRTRAWYAPLFDLPLSDYKGWAAGLQRAGYATNPNYSMLLVRIIEEHNLAELDKIQPLAQTQETIEKPIDLEVEYTPDEPITNVAKPSDDFLIVGREVEVNNRIQYIVARKGDTPESIGREFNKSARHIIEYNELVEGREISHGQIIYLQPKRNRGERSFHILQPGETMYDISQQYGIKLESLLDRNKMTINNVPLVGQRIRLR